VPRLEKGERTGRVLTRARNIGTRNAFSCLFSKLIGEGGLTERGTELITKSRGEVEKKKEGRALP